MLKPHWQKWQCRGTLRGFWKRQRKNKKMTSRDKPIHARTLTLVPDNSDLCGNTMDWQVVTAIVVTSRLSRPLTLLAVCLNHMYTLQRLQQLSSVMTREGCCSATRRCSLVMTDVSVYVFTHHCLCGWYNTLDNSLNYMPAAITPKESAFTVDAPKKTQKNTQLWHVRACIHFSFFYAFSSLKARHVILSHSKASSKVFWTTLALLLLLPAF